MNRTKILIITAAYVMAFGYSGCKKNETPEPQQAAYVRADAIAQPFAAPAEGTPAAATRKEYIKNEFYFKLPGSRGGDIDLAAYSGEPVMLMFFTERCPFCRKAAPFIETMNKKYSAKGLNVIGICVEDEASAAEGFVKAFNLTFPIAFKGSEVSRRYKTQGVPYIFLLSKSHMVHNMWAGYDPEFDQAIIRGIEEVIK
jgi:thiol-disulfide isomerase/thioredoxin